MTRSDSTEHHRRSIRLAGYDYTRNGAYFVTICLQDRACIFDKITNDLVSLNECGQIVVDSWAWLAVNHEYVGLDAYGVMPNHLHGIIVVGDAGTCRGGSRTAPTRNVGGDVPLALAPVRPDQSDARRKPLGRLIGAFKTVTARRINELRRTPGESVWQRNYYEHVIRSDAEFSRVRSYIESNPACWAQDRENPLVRSNGLPGPAGLGS